MSPEKAEDWDWSIERIEDTIGFLWNVVCDTAKEGKSHSYKRQAANHARRLREVADILYVRRSMAQVVKHDPFLIGGKND